MGWLYLLLAGCCEVLGVMLLGRMAQGKMRWQHWALCLLGFPASFGLLSLAMQSLPMGTAYAVWTGIGTAGSAVVGTLLYKESADWRRLLFLGMIVCSVIGLKLVT